MFRLKYFTTGFLSALVISTSALAQVNPFVDSDFSLDKTDLEFLGGAVSRLEGENVPLGTVIAWENPESHNRGTVKYVNDSDYQGMPCRRLQHDIWLENAARAYRFILDRCRMSDGSWKGL